MRVLRFVLLIPLCAAPAAAQLDFEREPIQYSRTEPKDAVAGLIQQMQSGDRILERDDEHGYLKSLLHALHVPVSSQTLVFSKTSFQRHRITPSTPRALYFNDDVYIGWVQRGDAIEISTADPTLGGVFYTLDQNQRLQAPTIVRQTDHCLICHASTHTRRVPGHILRSVYPDQRGLPVFSEGTYRTGHASAIGERWGGWYVTGTHGAQRHMGNATVTKTGDSVDLDRESGANLTDLSSRIRTEPYLTPHSDIVAHLVLAHQVTVHNAITAANYAARRNLYDARVMNEVLERPVDFESDSTKRRFANAASDLVDALLMVGEPRLTAPVEGTSEFANEFQQLGPFDGSRRSLRELNLKTRLFRYPCSYLVYSEAFRALPERLRQDVRSRLRDVLGGRDTDKKYSHLSIQDRAALTEILTGTGVLGDSLAPTGRP